MRRLAIFAIGVALGVPAWADVIISTYPVVLNGGEANIDHTTGEASGFTMNAGSDFDLTDIMVRLTYSGDSADAGDVRIGLFADDSGKPALSPLVTLTIPGTIGNGVNDYTATPGSSFTLLASTTYWLVLSDPNEQTNIFGWEIAGNGQAPTGPHAVDAGQMQLTMDSSTFTIVSEPQKAFTPSNFIYQIDGTEATSDVGGEVPEPSTLALDTIAFALISGLALWRRRSVA
jgi:hypothetical protein